MSYLSDKCTFRMFTPSLVADGAKFVCGDSDLDEFFHEDAFLQADQLLCKNYCFTSDENPNEVVCAFTLANDSIKKIPGSRKKKVEGAIPREKHYASYPAVMIGRLGVSQSMQGKNLGTDVLDFIKAWLVDPMNKTGCRFVLVDSYNQEKNFSIVPNYYKYFGKNMVYIGTRLEYKNGSKDYSKHADYDYLQTGLHMTDDQSYRNIYHNLNTTFGAYASYGFSDNANAALQYKFQYTDDYEKFDYQRNGGFDYNNSSEQTIRTFHNFFVLSGAFNVSKLTLKPSFTFDLQSEHTDYKRAALDTTCVRNNLLPKLTLDAIWKPNKLNNLKATLLYESKLPDVLSTMRYVDDTNPLYIIEGNPNLKRYANLGADVNYVLTIPKHEQMLSVTLKYIHLFDPIQSVLFYNTGTGAYRCRQENTKGKDSFSAEVGYDRSLGKYWEWQNNMTFSTASAYGVLTIFDNNSSRTLARQTVNTFNYNPTFKFQRDDWKLTLKSNVQIKYNSYENDAANDFTLYYYGADANVQKTFWQKFTVYLNGGFMGRKGYHTERFNHDYLIMSAGAWYKFMKNKLTVRLDFDDIFNKQRYCVYNATETSTSRAESLYANHLSNYVKLTLTYDFDAKGGKKK